MSEDTRPEAYFWAEGDEIRRAFIIDVMADADIDGVVLVSNMEVVFRWLKSGELPKKTKTRLDTIKGSDHEGTKSHIVQAGN